MLSAWLGASLTTGAPQMVSGITSVPAVGKAGGYRGHTETVIMVERVSGSEANISPIRVLAQKVR